MENKKNILIVIPNMIGGGAQKTVANLSFFLNNYYNVHILTFFKTENTYDFRGQLHVIERDYKIKNPLLRKLSFISYIKRIRDIKDSLNITCSISFLPEADILNVLSQNKEKIILSIRNKLSSSQYLKGYTRYLFMYAVRKADLIISITEGVRIDMIDNFHVSPNKIKTIYNPLERLSNEFERETLNGNVFLTMGRLENQKGQWHLIRAFKNVVDKNSKAMLYILGEGSLRNYLENLIDDLGLENNVKLIGFVENTKYYLARTDFFVFPSLYEGLGNSLLEVLQLGIPIISSDCKYGPREILSPESDITQSIDKMEIAKYGILVPVCDSVKYNAYDKVTKEEEILGEAMLFLMNNRELQSLLKKRGLERSKDFAINHIGSKWMMEIEK